MYTPRLVLLCAVLVSLVGCGSLHPQACAVADKATADARQKREKQLDAIVDNTAKSAAHLQTLVNSLPPPKVKKNP